MEPFDLSDMLGKYPKRRVEHSILYYDILQTDTPPAGWNYSANPICRGDTPSAEWNEVTVPLWRRGPLTQGGKLSCRSASRVSMDSLAQYAGVWSTGVCTANDLVIGGDTPLPQGGTCRSGRGVAREEDVCRPAV